MLATTGRAAELGMASCAEVAAWAVRAGVARDPDPAARA
jgi:hypothetical protein